MTPPDKSREKRTSSRQAKPSYDKSDTDYYNLAKFFDSVWCAAVDAATSKDFRDENGELNEADYVKYREATERRFIEAIATREGEAARLARIDELAAVRIRYGHMIAATSIGGKWQTLTERLERLSSTEGAAAEK